MLMEIESKINEHTRKYESIIIVAKEARRLNARRLGRTSNEMVTTIAMKRYVESKIKYGVREEENE
jgi:DNA-directed RNA polymerase subunit K/omega